jgi:hypothetical protein
MGGSALNELCVVLCWLLPLQSYLPAASGGLQDTAAAVPQYVLMLLLLFLPPDVVETLQGPQAEGRH